MDKDAVLTHILSSKGMMSTLLGGKLPVRVITDNEYIPPLTSEALVTDRNADYHLSSLDHCIRSTLSGKVKTVILVGPEGSGKTTALQKLVVDWAKGEHLQKFSYVFYFQLREMNSLQGMMSLETFLQHHQSHFRVMPLFLQKPEDALFIFDDLDQYGHSLDPSVHSLCSDPSQEASVSCLMASLLQGSLLKGATFVLATRATVCLDFLNSASIEVLGFLKPQREAYFNRFFRDQSAASKALIHMERTVGVYDFCVSPRFCWTLCSIYKSLMDGGRKLPETLCQLYVDIMVHLLQPLSLSKDCNRGLVLALGRMASQCCLDQQPYCTKEEMDSFGFQQFFSSVAGFLQIDGNVENSTCVFSFHSRLILEFILAMFVFLNNSSSERVEKMWEKHKFHAQFLDLFLSGLSEAIQRRPLESLLGEFNSDKILDFKCWFKSSSKAALKECYKEMHYRCFHLLYQAQNEGLVKEIITSTAQMGIGYGDLRLSDCVALNYVITCLGEMKQLNLYHTTDLTEGKAQILTPAMSLSHKIILSNSSLSPGAVRHLASALCKGITKELDLSHTNLGDEKFSILCVGLRDCKLHNLNLLACSLTSCEDLVSVLTSATCQLGVLKMMFNPIGDFGFIKLCKALHSPQCKLQELWLQRCEITAESMEALSAALCSGQSQLRKVDLTQNTISDSGVKTLCKSLQHPLCRLQSLILCDNELTGACCPHLEKALMSEHCCLSELDLSVNDLDQEGALLLCRALNRPGCPIENLRLKRCQLTQSVFKELGSVLRNGTSQLKSLIIGINNVEDQGVKHLWNAVSHPSCLLEELDVEMTALTDACVEDVCAAIRASKTLKSLEMRNNSLTDASVPALVQVMQDSNIMQEMNLKYNNFSEDVFDMLEECDKIRY